MPPPVPPGPGFLKRIKDRALDRIQDRVKRELAPEVLRPTDEDMSDAPARPEEVDRGFLKRITDKAKNKLRNFSPIQRRLLDPRQPLDDATIKYRIHYAGQNKVLLLMTYNGQSRLVEAYSYRWRGKPDAGGKRALRFFGACRLHGGKIHAFNLNKIEAIQVTDMPYRERWPVEV